jgi:hypothetical protein
MTFDHSLGGEERLDLFSENGNAVRLPHPLGTLRAKSEALQSETNTCLATTVGVGLLVTFLSPYPTGVTTRLCTDSAFGLGRSGLLLNFSVGRGGE